MFDGYYNINGAIISFSLKSEEITSIEDINNSVEKHTLLLHEGTHALLKSKNGTGMGHIIGWGNNAFLMGRRI